MRRVDEACKGILSAPRSYPVTYRQLRRALVKQFPFAIFYELLEDSIKVVAGVSRPSRSIEAKYS